MVANTLYGTESLNKTTNQNQNQQLTSVVAQSANYTNTHTGTITIKIDAPNLDIQQLIQIFRKGKPGIPGDPGSCKFHYLDLR